MQEITIQKGTNQKLLKKSKYAFFIKEDIGSYLIYSSMSGIVLRCMEEKQLDQLNEILNSEKIFYDENNDVIKLFFERGILVEEHENEKQKARYIYEQKIISNRKLELMIVVTRQCNFRCVYCGQEHLDLKMDWNIYENILKYINNMLFSKQYDSLSISFFGGEPLLEYNNMIKFLERANEISIKNNSFFSSGMSTNGYLLTPEKFEKLTQLNCSGYQISLDGMYYTHNKTRPLVNGSGSWETIMKNISYMKSSDIAFEVNLRTNFNAEVFSSMEELYEIFGRDFNDLRFQIYAETIKDQGMACERLDEIAGVISEIDISNLLKENSLRSINLQQRTFPGRVMCYASKPNHFVIDYNGEVKMCSNQLDREENIIGKLNNEGVMELNENKHSRWIYNDCFSHDKCNECKLLPLCFGCKCPLNIGKNAWVPCNCDLLEYSLEKTLLNFYKQ